MTRDGTISRRRVLTLLGAGAGALATGCIDSSRLTGESPGGSERRPDRSARSPREANDSDQTELLERARTLEDRIRKVQQERFEEKVGFERLWQALYLRERLEAVRADQPTRDEPRESPGTVEAVEIPPELRELSVTPDEMDRRLARISELNDELARLHADYRELERQLAPAGVDTIHFDFGWSAGTSSSDTPTETPAETTAQPPAEECECVDASVSIRAEKGGEEHAGVDDSSVTSAGHAFVVVTRTYECPDGTEKTEQMGRGLYPDGAGMEAVSVGVDGTIMDDTAHDYDCEYEKSVSCEEAAALAAKMKQAAKNPPDYHAATNNCVDWAVKMFDSATGCGDELDPGAGTGSAVLGGIVGVIGDDVIDTPTELCNNIDDGVDC